MFLSFEADHKLGKQAFFKKLKASSNRSSPVCMTMGQTHLASLKFPLESRQSEKATGNQQREEKGSHCSTSHYSSPHMNRLVQGFPHNRDI